MAADVVNYMKYDAQVFGNHDVETGHPVYDKWIKELNCPVLGSNIISTSTGEPYVKPYLVLNREGVKVSLGNDYSCHSKLAHGESLERTEI